jgi:hypothetical protein
MSIYVEIDIAAPVDDLWDRTQSPELHERWDLRFTEIDYLPRPDASLPQRFVYATRIGFGLVIAGEGETRGDRNGADGSRTSALRFWSDDAKSLIRVGSGYWKYIPTSSGTRFLTRYDYTTRFGAIGRIVDRALFRPLLGWATAWSFDRLRLWIERGIDPAASMRLSIVHAVSRTAIALVWIYHGLVPKLLFERPEELAMIVATGLPAEHAVSLMTIMGIAEVSVGAAFLLFWKARWLFVASALAMGVLFVAVAAAAPATLAGAFNPVSLDLLMIALAIVGLVASREIPNSRRCRRAQSEASS